jgi:hypothetical protein
LFESQLKRLGDLFDSDFIQTPEELPLHASTYTQRFFEDHQVPRGIALRLAKIIAKMIVKKMKLPEPSTIFPDRKNSI